MTDAAVRPDRAWHVSLILLAAILGVSLLGIGILLGQWIERADRPACRGEARS